MTSSADNTMTMKLATDGWGGARLQAAGIETEGPSWLLFTPQP
jgi:hypothetical protein